MTKKHLMAALVSAVLPISAAAQDFGVDMPKNPAPGVSFPAPETEINKWVFAVPQNSAKIIEHAWGIWAGLTAETGKTAFGIDNALTYQTWLSPAGIIALMNGDDSSPLTGLKHPGQFGHSGMSATTLVDETPVTADGMKVDIAIAEVVAYSPPAAAHLYNNKLLWTDTLYTLLQDGYDQVPTFPYQAVNIKPVYKLITKDELNKGGIYAMPAWPGTSNVSNWTEAEQARGFPNAVAGGKKGTIDVLWGQCTYIDVNNSGRSDANAADPTCNNPTAENTFGLGDFIHIKITGSDDNCQREGAGDKGDLCYYEDLTGDDISAQVTVGGKSVTVEQHALKDGDILILVGMHVTSRETTRWTWQTYWWAANPDAPNLPSSPEIAKMRPNTLSYEASHYAMAHAYSMLNPAQGLVGGRNIGSLVTAYNPHLEAGFGSGVFGETQAVLTPTGEVTTNLGVQSNCMSCHGMAGYGTANSTYVSNFYVPRNAPNFKGGMTVDFAWSIPVEAQPKNTK